MKEKSPCSRNWTLWHQTLFCCGVACCSVMVVAMAAVVSPVLFVPGLWDEYTAWSEIEGE